VEIGCASGEFCGTLAGHGANVTGIDLSVEAIAIAKDRHPGVTFVRGTLEDYASTTQIDVLFAFELIEHVTSPMVFLRTAAARLTSGGYVVLSTPNLSCGERVGFGSWLGFNSSMEHLYFFDVNTLHAYGRALGLQLVQSFTGHGDGRIDREPPKPRPFRKAVREVLRYSGLLSTAKTAREFLGRWRPQYTDDRYAHNLVVILRKPL
jgi:SAM-dependent methyltransferase